MKTITAFLFCFLIIISCKKAEEVVCLPDLVGAVELPGVVTILTGGPFSVPIVIKSLDCQYLPTSPFKVKLVVFRDLSGNGTFEEIDQEVLFTTQFLGSDTLTESVEISFNQPGNFRFSVCVDVNNEIEERDEANNCSL
ncbi:MAG: hypothetical protein IPL65_07750 [Lewinellaceae bacterium]|nr:hypothetical protein [Lewinellaceae bacterium]